MADQSLLYRSCSRDVLHRAGYRVLVAEDAASMLHAAAATREIDLLLADERLVEAGVPELTRHFREHHPRAPVLVMTEPTRRSSCRQPRGKVILRHPKPGHPAELLGMVTTVLAPAPLQVGDVCATSRSSAYQDLASRHSCTQGG